MKTTALAVRFEVWRSYREMAQPQPLLLAPVPAFGRFLELDVAPSRDPRACLDRLAAISPRLAVVGLGAPLLSLLGASVPLSRTFPALSGVGVAYPSTQRALWIFVAGSTVGEVVDRARRVLDAVDDAFVVRQQTDTFKYHEGRDLSGYEDGTENPVDDAAVDAAIVAGGGVGLDGSSMVAVQRWTHDLARFRALTERERDDVVGRRRSDNEELAEAPASAHVKRAAQESFEPAAFIVRRSMPWSEAGASGLYFVAFGRTFDAFEQISRRMLGLEDGVVDGLFVFSRPDTGGYYWCPPVADDALDLSLVGAPSRTQALSEADGVALLKAAFEAAGFQIAERFTFDEGGVFAELDGWDAAARVGYEYITSEAGDRLEFTPAAIATLEDRMKKDELYVLLIDERDVGGAAALSRAADEFLSVVAARRAAR